MDVKHSDDKNRYFRKKIIKEVRYNLTCIEVATNIFNLNMERSRSNARYLKPVEHSSMVFDLKRNVVYWNARGSTPLNVIDFYVEYTNKTPYEAINELLNYYNNRNPLAMEHYIYDELTNEAYIQKGLVLPEKYENNETAIDYLINIRKLNKDIIDDLIKKDCLFEDIYHNAVFVSHDAKTNTVPVFALRRGTGQSKFQLDCAGSYKLNGFYYSRKTNNQKSDVLYVFESVIDGLSYISLNPDKNIKILCSSGCGPVLNTIKYNLVNNPDLKEIKEINLMLDNDEAGKIATERIVENLSHNSFSFNGNVYPISFVIKENNYYLNYHDLKKEVKDVNELLKAVSYLEENDIQTKDESLVI